jgi:hypothetical protein
LRENILHIFRALVSRYFQRLLLYDPWRAGTSVFLTCQLKFRYYEKATKFEKIFHFFLTLCTYQNHRN